MAEAGTGGAEAGTDTVVESGLFEVASFRLMAGVNCMGAESLEWLWKREEPSMKGGAKCSRLQGGFTMLGRGAGLLANAENSSAISWCHSPSHPGVESRFVKCCCSGLPMKSLVNSCRRFSGWH